MNKKAIELAIEDAVDAFSVNLYAGDAPREHLGVSIIGEDCAAKIWFGFRWAKFGRWEGRMLRLFNTGHVTEARFITWFRSIGFEVHDFDADGSQFRISALQGHFGGSLDSFAIYRGVDLPTLSQIVGTTQAAKIHELLAPLLNQHVLMEFKTHNKRNFARLKKYGVAMAFPKHHTQYSTYGTFYQMKYTLYCGYCKDNDELWVELKENDASLADDMVRKGEEIIFNNTMPRRIAMTPTYIDCMDCTFKDICHNKAPMLKSCRSCKFAYAAENAQWYCVKWKNHIPPDFIATGCKEWMQLDVK